MAYSPLTDLCKLAAKYGTDKGGEHTKLGTCHNYTRAYHKLLKDTRQHIKQVLEIGILDGASLRMWADYFPNARITGIDNDLNRIKPPDGRIVYLHADQGRLESFDRVLEGQEFELIVDDGSHIPDHQINCANYLQKYLVPAGLYVIEDIYFDCRPETILDHITWGSWAALPVGRGLGGAYCECGCGGGEVLLVGLK